MASVDLSKRDINVLQKIRDPESDPLRGANVGSAVSPDPHVTDPAVYGGLVDRERDIIRSLQGPESVQRDLVEPYRQAVDQFGALASEHPDYGSARNNRAQALRRLYGDNIITDAPADPAALANDLSREGGRIAAGTILLDLGVCVKLLTPESPASLISHQAARTLAAAHMQRGTMYLCTARLLGQGHHLDVPDGQGGAELAGWTRLEFEEAASRDFAAAGRYGDEMGKVLAVSINPTAKLCGEIVREAMRKEYGEGFAG